MSSKPRKAGDASAPLSLSDVNRRNAEFWEARSETIDPIDAFLDSASREEVRRWNDDVTCWTANDQVAPFRDEIVSLLPAADRGRAADAAQRESLRKMAAATTKYTVQQKERWRAMAADDDLQGKSKTNKAKIIANREGLSPKVADYIRKLIY